ncbi:N-glycosylase/DNA lyase [candidate division WOR-3 bacterium]|nr:N-glycosylase/DNA lyase [candidate division WOR-3 bacterium]
MKMITENSVKNAYTKIKSRIERKIADFKKTGRSEENVIFKELVFCILTPQSSAKRCWSAVESLDKDGLLYDGGQKDISELLVKKTRFHNCKSQNIILARRMLEKPGFSGILYIDDDFAMRDQLVSNVRGFGFKEASHFMRNIGRGEKVAILDRHILRCMMALKVMDKLPGSMSKKKYLETETMFSDLSQKLSIPLPHLDLVLWYLSTGEIFK